MTEQPQKKSRIEKLELNPETVAELTEGEAEKAKGGLAGVRDPLAAGGDIGCEGNPKTLNTTHFTCVCP